MTISMPFEIADIVIAIVLIISGFLAYFRGLVREVLSLATWIGSALAAYYAFPYAQPYARALIGVKGVADAAAGVVLFIVALLILTLLSHVISGRVKESALGAMDRGLGFLFGLARGALLICVAYIVANWIWENEDLTALIGQPRTMPYVQDGADLLRQVIPKNVTAESKSVTKDARKKAGQALEGKKLYDQLRNSQEGESPPAYDKNQRREMQRLIDTNR